ncbi:MAG: hypothetical protein HYR88_00270 [Verrucomicrobia bacterium]|nr:hypothetical protein [Verrucomicrobiota bacterium]
MTRNHFWKLLLILFVLGWAFYELYPPTGQNLVDYFEQKGVRRDATFTNIVSQARALEKQNSARTYANLFDAVGTNDIVGYFDYAGAAEQRNPATFILGKLQREAAGRIRLGLDLQGGTSFLMGVDPKTTGGGMTRDQLLSQAVEVLRRRVDRFGVAEPIIQPAGVNRILVQLPGLSESDRDSARRQLSKAAYLAFCVRISSGRAPSWGSPVNS